MYPSTLLTHSTANPIILFPSHLLNYVKNLRSDWRQKVLKNATGASSEHASITLTEYHNTPEGGTITKLDQILLNGNNVAMVGQLQLFITL